MPDFSFSPRPITVIGEQCLRIARAYRRNEANGLPATDLNQVRLRCQAQALLWVVEDGLTWSAADDGALLLFRNLEGDEGDGNHDA